MPPAADFARSGRKILAIGRNYAAHIAELNNTTPAEPFFFLKPNSSVVEDGVDVEVPQGVEVHHEIELGVVIGKGGRDIKQADAMEHHVAGYCLAVDYTGRNMQNQVKAKGLPWAAAKGMDTWCPVSSFIPADQVKNPHNLDIWYKVNGEYRQNGNTKMMLSDIPRLIEHCSSIMRLDEGDLILTGTPEGVSKVVAGDKITCGLEEDGKQLATLSHTMVAREGGYKFNPAL